MVNLRNRCSCARRAPRTEALRRIVGPSLLALLLASGGCGHADPAAGKAAGSANPAPGQGLCVPSTRGYLRARLQGSITLDIDWAAGVPQCRGGRRPSGDGIRLLYKGTDAAGSPLLVVLGAGPLRAGETARNVPVNLTVVREGAGEFYATQGDDKCVLDEVRQEPLPGKGGQYVVTGRGFCTAPARAVGGAAGSVLVSRFDLEAIVDYNE
jgi:hypothetical protein